MHRAPLLALLEDYLKSPLITPQEIEFVSDIVKFVNKEPNCFERSLIYGHITGSAFIVNGDGSKTLLLHHKKLNIWIQPGGHADGDNDIAKVALKESIEESGIIDLVIISPFIFDVDIHYIPKNSTAPEHNHFDIRFLIQAPFNTNPQKNHESNHISWIDLDYIKDYTNEKSILRMVEKWKKIKKFY
jgi:8-oxo-dGTP pyrophosphatase MutT (NUDIX family)